MPPPTKTIGYRCNGNTVTTNDNYTGDEPYPYHLQYKDESQPFYELIKLDNHFLPQFKIPYDVIPSVDLVCKLSLPNKLINTIANQSTKCAKVGIIMSTRRNLKGK